MRKESQCVCVGGGGGGYRKRRLRIVRLKERRDVCRAMSSHICAP
jgi:hypothetical protein